MRRDRKVPSLLKERLLRTIRTKLPLLVLVGLVAAIIGLSTLYFTVILAWTGALDWLTLGIFVVVFNFVQWLMKKAVIRKYTLSPF